MAPPQICIWYMKEYVNYIFKEKRVKVYLPRTCVMRFICILCTFCLSVLQKSRKKSANKIVNSFLWSLTFSVNIRLQFEFAGWCWNSNYHRHCRIWGEISKIVRIHILKIVKWKSVSLFQIRMILYQMLPSIPSPEDNFFYMKCLYIF